MSRPYTYKLYDQSHVVAKYIGYVGETLNLYEVNDKSQTLKSYPIKPESVAKKHAGKAKEQQGMAFNQVKIWSKR